MTEVTSELRVYTRHIRAAKVCMGGSRQFFVKHNLDWNDFLDNGIPGTAEGRSNAPVREADDPI
jgi:hypothetical protein